MSEIDLLKGLDHVVMEVSFALAPLLLFFIFFQIFFLKLPRQKIIDIIKGVILTFFGLILFLHGVHVGFLPFGEAMGEKFAALPYKWIIIPVGFVLGFVATFAEPAVRILNYEVDKVTAGYIPQRLMLITLSIGVGFSIALSMARVIYDLPLMYFVIGGYGIVIVMAWFTSETFTAIAFDSGGVATGPMTVTFITALSLGIAGAEDSGRSAIDGFGMIALVALAPILSVLTLGVLYKFKENKSSQ
ncbi:MAG: DUF1538 domain-containing protein [Bacteroidetes bacterium]|nr:DUF1538 domain-containing protein [Bacteroidota bacterium]MCH8524331.1 DUF1538 domain-containing protein [Balneolales bacterium]